MTLAVTSQHDLFSSDQRFSILHTHTYVISNSFVHVTCTRRKASHLCYIQQLCSCYVYQAQNLTLMLYTTALFMLRVPGAKPHTYVIYNSFVHVTCTRRKASHLCYIQLLCSCYVYQAQGLTLMLYTTALFMLRVPGARPHTYVIYNSFVHVTCTRRKASHLCYIQQLCSCYVYQAEGLTLMLYPTALFMLRVPGAKPHTYVIYNSFVHVTCTRRKASHLCYIQQLCSCYVYQAQSLTLMLYTTALFMLRVPGGRPHTYVISNSFVHVTCTRRKASHLCYIQQLCSCYVYQAQSLTLMIYTTALFMLRVPGGRPHTYVISNSFVHVTCTRRKASHLCYIQQLCSCYVYQAQGLTLMLYTTALFMLRVPGAKPHTYVIYNSFVHVTCTRRKASHLCYIQQLCSCYVYQAQSLTLLLYTTALFMLHVPGGRPHTYVIYNSFVHVTCTRRKASHLCYIQQLCSCYMYQAQGLTLMLYTTALFMLHVPGARPHTYVIYNSFVHVTCTRRKASHLCYIQQLCSCYVYQAQALTLMRTVGHFQPVPIDKYKASLFEKM